MASVALVLALGGGAPLVTSPPSPSSPPALAHASPSHPPARLLALGLSGPGPARADDYAMIPVYPTAAAAPSPATRAPLQESVGGTTETGQIAFHVPVELSTARAWLTYQFGLLRYAAQGVGTVGGDTAGGIVLVFDGAAPRQQVDVTLYPQGARGLLVAYAASRVVPPPRRPDSRLPSDVQQVTITAVAVTTLVLAGETPGSRPLRTRTLGGDQAAWVVETYNDLAPDTEVRSCGQGGTEYDVRVQSASAVAQFTVKPDCGLVAGIHGQALADDQGTMADLMKALS